ncbi:MAG: hypothetical protein V1645_05205 [archaeon]
MHKDYGRQNIPPHATTAALPNSLEQHVMAYEAAKRTVSAIKDYITTQLDLGKLVEKAISLKNYLHDTPITTYADRLGGYFFAKSAEKGNRKQKILKERAKKRAEKEKRMQNPGGSSKYAKKSGSGNEAFWKDKGHTPIIHDEDYYRSYRW